MSFIDLFGTMADSEVHTIKEVSLILDEEQHVLRFWEREFEFLHPKKNESGNRIYDQRDLAILKELKRLIRTERKTIQEARTAFQEAYPSGFVKMPNGNDQACESHDEIASLQQELRDIINKLRS
ncbi:MAG: MerR family transcriptional regulator [Ignavibacteria bacterium]|nr:MerR family transcriptional regulator [Ignavibacteria bacterium]